MKAKQKTMLGVIATVWVTACWGSTTGFAAQLPPEIMVDKYLLQAQMLSEEKDYKGALEAMDRVVVLQKEHGLTLPEEFPFHYAQAALAAGAVQAAIDSVNQYLSAAGREGKHYRQALELLVEAEQSLSESAVDQAGAGAPELDLEPQPQVVPPAPLQTPKITAAQPVPDCKKWNKRKFFKKATVQDVTACLEAGADPNAQGKWQNTPLHWAALNESTFAPAVIEALLKAGADPMARDRQKRTPLHDAARVNENPAVVEALIRAGADPNAQGKWQRTPLHQAALNESTSAPAVIEALLEAGADPTMWDHKDKTPLQVARKRNRKVLRNAWARLPESQKAAARKRTESQSGGGGGWAALVAGVTGATIASASGLDAATATELGAAIGGSVLAGEAGSSSGTAAASGGTSGNTGATAGGGTCQVPGYPNPPGGVANLGFSWCPASVGMQVRAFALQAAGAQCAIATGSSSTPEQIEARRREIRAACDRLASLGQGNCQCPAGLGQ